MEVKAVERIGTVALVVGVSMMVIGGFLWFYEEQEEVPGPKYPTTIAARPYADIGHWLCVTGLLIVILDIGVVVAGFALKRARRKRKGG
jgi:hypothetical protein